MRNFETGATRDVDTNKLDYEGFLSPAVLERFAQYMHQHRKQADGSLRSSDNWQKGIPKDVYMKSAMRHFMDFWKEHRGIDTEYGLEESLTALLFNVMGYLFEVLKENEKDAELTYSITQKGLDALASFHGVEFTPEIEPEESLLPLDPWETTFGPIEGTYPQVFAVALGEKVHFIAGETERQALLREAGEYFSGIPGA